MAAEFKPRVLSLLSASTEIVHRLGCGHLLVGRSHGCDDPPIASVLPVATAPKVDPSASSRELDAAVRAQAAAGGPIYQIHSDFVRSARPDIIITQEQCRICAVTPEDVATVCEHLPTTKLVTIKPTTLDDVLGDVQTIATALGVPVRGERLVQMLRTRLAAITALVASVSRHAPPVRVAHVEWLAPLMGSGYWIAECVAAAGCTMVHGSVGGHSPTLESLSQLSEADVIVLAPCGFGIERTQAELQALGLLQSAEWQALPAVRAGAVAVADGNLYFNRSSCGVLESAEIVAEIAHDELCGMWGHHGRYWVRLHELAAFCARESAPAPTKRVALAVPAMLGDGEGEGEGERDRDGLKRQRSASALEGGVGGATSGPTAHVKEQIRRLRAADFAAAFALNSTANRARLGSAAQFEAVVRANSSFAALADGANACECREQGGSRVGVRTVVASVQKPHETIAFVFDLCELPGEDGVFATDGVRIEC